MTPPLEVVAAPFERVAKLLFAESGLRAIDYRTLDTPPPKTSI
jgi:hypothetical protein